MPSSCPQRALMEPSAQRSHPEGDSPDAGRSPHYAQSFSPPHVSFLLTSADARPPPSHGPFSVTVPQHLVPSCFPGQRKETDWLSVLDPDWIQMPVCSQPSAPCSVLSQSGPCSGQAAPPVGKPCLPSLSPHLLALLTTSAPPGQSSSFGMAAAVPAQVGETFGIDSTGPREALAS